MRPIIAPYWADVDTRSGSGRVYYKQTTSIALRSRVARRVQMVYGENFTPTHLFIATWYHVGYYNRHMNRVSVYAAIKLLTVEFYFAACHILQRNSFQVVIASDARHSFIFFIYDRLQWTTGDASGGRNGVGGRSARAGINAGDGRNSLSIYGSGTSLMLRMNYNSNCGVRGVFVLSPGRGAF